VIRIRPNRDIDMHPCSSGAVDGPIRPEIQHSSSFDRLPLGNVIVAGRCKVTIVLPLGETERKNAFAGGLWPHDVAFTIHLSTCESPKSCSKSCSFSVLMVGSGRVGIPTAATLRTQSAFSVVSTAGRY
jgi:hypothetical protein